MFNRQNIYLQHKLGDKLFVETVNPKLPSQVTREAGGGQKR